MDEPDRGRLGLFFGTLLGLALLIVAASRIANVGVIAFAPVYMFTPLVAGLVVCIGRGIPVRAVGMRLGRPRWLIASTILALPLIGLTLVLSVATPGIGFDPTADPTPGMALPSGFVGLLAVFGLVLAVGATVNAVFGLGEEFGWRGYLLWELAPLGFWRSSFAVGTAWGLWHAPIIVEGYNYPSFPILGVAVMTAACIAFSPLYTYLVVRTESVLAAALFHGVFNGSAGLVLVYTAPDTVVLDEIVANPVGLAGIVTFALIAVGITARGTPTTDRGAIAGAASRDSVAGDR